MLFLIIIDIMPRINLSSALFIALLVLALSTSVEAFGAGKVPKFAENNFQAHR
jgi:hypothetical protein